MVEQRHEIRGGLFSKFLFFQWNWSCSFSAELIRSVIAKVEVKWVWEKPPFFIGESLGRMSIYVDRCALLSLTSHEAKIRDKNHLFRDPGPSCPRLLVLASCGVNREKYYFRWGEIFWHILVNVSPLFENVGRFLISRLLNIPFLPDSGVKGVVTEPKRELMLPPVPFENAFF